MPHRMFDLLDLFTLPKNLVLALFRGLWWLGWDFCVQTIGWTLGWIVCRTLTLGRFPAQGITRLDEANLFHALVVEMIGLALIAVIIYRLSENWPSL